MELVDPQQVPPLQRSNSSAQVPPFPLLIGEHPLLIAKTTDGNAMVTNFRFCVCERRSFINIPLMTVGDLLVIEAAKRLRIGCKDGSTYICSFASSDDCNMCSALLRDKTGQPSSLKTLFAYSFFRLASQKQISGLTQAEQDQIALCQPVSQAFAYSFGKEVERLGFDTSRRRVWKMSHANENYEFCPTYPKLHILPANVEDDKLKTSLDFRAMKRFPSVVWRDKKSGMVLIRSSQPLSSFLGLSYYQNHADVFLIEEIVNACNKDREFLLMEEQRKAGLALLESESIDIRGQENGSQEGNLTGILNQEGAQGSLVSENGVGHGASNGTYVYDDSRSPRKLAIVDCRSLAGVWGNSFKGGGTEDEVVYKCNTIHLDLANIHTVRDSFNRLRTLCHSYVEGTYYKNLTGCNWLAYISALLRGANIVVELMHVKQRPVLVHCSDGWDRTAQIVSLSELMMDPYYRTLEGFQVLIEREWLHFGHKFGERGGHDPNCSDTNQISPIFLQFLDCVYQLTLQYPAEFQFSEAYLVKLLKHSQACLFGTFLHNCPRERESCPYKTASVWALLRPDFPQFVNLLYKPSHQVLTAKYSEHDTVLWKSVYMAGQSPWPHGSQTDFYLDSSLAGGGEDVGNPGADGLPRSRSMENLCRINSDSGRRNSDPSATQLQEVAAAAPGVTGIHDTSSSSAEILHYPEDSPPAGFRSPSSKFKEADCPKPTHPTHFDSINNGEPNPEDSSPSSQSGTLQGEDVATPCNGDDTADTVLQGVKQDNSPNRTLDKAHDGAECGSINEAEAILMEDIRTQTLVPTSSAVFCQEEVGRVNSKNGQTLCCDSSPDSQVLSSEPYLSTLQDNVNCHEVRNSQSCSQRNGVSEERAPDCGPRHKVNSNKIISSSKAVRQTSLLSERLASSGDVPVNGHHTGTHSKSDRVNQIHGEEKQHSRNSEDINGHRTLLKAQPAREGSKTESSPCSINRKCGTPTSRTGSLETCLVLQSCSPSQAVNGCRTHSNSASTDTLTDELEAGGGDSVPPSTSTSTKPLEVITRAEWHQAAPASSSSSVSISSSLKRESHLSEAEMTNGTNLLSRRARAASGASRDLSVSPSVSTCVCRGNWSDTGRLRHPSGEMSRRILGASVATSTTDISDSCVGQQLTVPSIDRQQSIKQHIDVDGLTLFCDERQELMTELVSEKDRKINELEKRLVQAIEMLKTPRHMQSQQQPPPALLDDSLASDNEGGELSSLGAMSNPASDASWETIDESEAKMVLWVPDSAVTHCAGCDGAFSLCKRKHHCRNCGKVFCADCSNYMAPVPHQHLNKPERVCRRCHSDLLQLSPGASSDGRIPTLVADG